LACCSTKKNNSTDKEKSNSLILQTKDLQALITFEQELEGIEQRSKYNEGKRFAPHTLLTLPSSHYIQTTLGSLSTQLRHRDSVDPRNLVPAHQMKE